MCVSVLLGCAVVAGSVVLCDAGFLKFGSGDCVIVVLCSVVLIVQLETCV